MRHALPDVHPALQELVCEASDRGWRHDDSKGAPPARWIDDTDRQQLTVVAYDIDFRTAIITAETPDDKFRTSIGDQDRIPHAVRSVRAFLGWDMPERGGDL